MSACCKISMSQYIEQFQQGINVLILDDGKNPRREF